MATAPDPVAPDHVVGGKYRLVRRIAEGGMGSVWLARHEVLDMDVAVKLMSKEVALAELGLARFEREAKASAQLKSQHIVRVHDYGMDDDTPFMVMELLEGEDLGVRLKRDGPMSVAQLAPLFEQICKGLEVAHDAGFVHRDLKPSNVFLVREGEDEIVKLVDFGVARETKTKLVEDKTSSGVVVGSPHHMSPEQAHGEAVDHRSDLWSLGVLVYRALTGEKPFSGEIMTAILLAVVSHPIPNATDVRPDLPPDVDRFIRHALTRNVDARFQRARTMSAALTAIAEGKDVTPFLTGAADQDEDGREEATVPSGASVALLGEPPAERTASRTVGAVTAGVIATSGVARRARVWPWVALAAGVGVAAFMLGRTGSEPTPATTTTTASSQAAPVVVVPTVASEPQPSATPSSPRVEPSSAPPVAPSQPRIQPAVRPAQPVTPPKPRIDPFTGLPIQP